jgi:bifunctional non-homologous end joining protein LigD
MADSTRLPMRDRRREPEADVLVAGDVSIPARGNAPVEVDGRVIELTSLDRVLWPEAGFTKAELVAYMLSVADVMLPHLEDRPLTVGRFPGGVDGRGFAQAEIPGRPEWVRSVPITLSKGAVKRFTVVETRAALVWLAQMGVLELHTFLGEWPALTRPRAILFDLDPMAPAGLLEAAEAALLLRAVLGARGVTSFVKTSGSLGLHVLVPVTDARAYDETKAFAVAVAAALAERRPDLASVQMRRAGREGRVLVDTRQNSERLTLIVPYSLRSAPRPTASTPLAWPEVERAVEARDVASLVFEAGAIAPRVAHAGDPMAPFLAMLRATR